MTDYRRAWTAKASASTSLPVPSTGSSIAGSGRSEPAPRGGPRGTRSSWRRAHGGHLAARRPRLPPAAPGILPDARAGPAALPGDRGHLHGHAVPPPTRGFPPRNGRHLHHAPAPQRCCPALGAAVGSCGEGPSPSAINYRLSGSRFTIQRVRQHLVSGHSAPILVGARGRPACPSPHARGLRVRRTLFASQPWLVQGAR